MYLELKFLSPKLCLLHTVVTAEKLKYFDRHRTNLKADHSLVWWSYQTPLLSVCIIPHLKDPHDNAQPSLLGSLIKMRQYTQRQPRNL